MAGDGVGTKAITTATGKSKITVWRWQAPFADAGVDRLLEDKNRPPGKAPIADARVGELVRLTLNTVAAWSGFVARPQHRGRLGQLAQKARQGRRRGRDLSVFTNVTALAALR